ncbi:uncharacterized protein LOC115421351 [Sphaeramia orbicularis]|uniref:uncharacterized protein LOC115421351 n=1 Tax=Sphaeramia orbicularis TaxID=375764 RepID=UPI00117C80BC|nr:uncharacterized protein LOC115421351 [Sphaeramia orbicularis]XP_029993076.1 uncharacterized protein LOC115421351 [Sphaeramia orbicularis]
MNSSKSFECDAEMGFRMLHVLLWLLTVFTFTGQASVRLTVTPNITAECGKPVTLTCNASSLDGLRIMYMEWSQNETYCSVDSEGNPNKPHTQKDFSCEYKEGLLSITFKKVQPLQSKNPFRCKLRSNRGSTHRYTRMELQECYGSVEAAQTADGPSCTFKQVYPDGDVHWFHGSHNLSDGSLSRVTKRVDKGGWLTIQSYLDKEGSAIPYNCSLKSIMSDRYMTSSLVWKQPQGRSRFGNAASALAPLWTSLCFTVFLAFTLAKYIFWTE